MSNEKLFIEVASNPHTWWSTAHTLMSSANNLYEVYKKAENEFIERIAQGSGIDTMPRDIQLGVQQYAVVLMLTGMAIEDVLKGILISRDPRLVSENKLKDISHHNLWKLTKDNKIKLEYPSQEELQDLLVRLQAHLEWVGRYPIPTGPHKLAPIHLENTNTEVFGNASVPIADYGLAQTVFAELISILESEPTFIAHINHN